VPAGEEKEGRKFANEMFLSLTPANDDSKIDVDLNH
jgi:hypothetical protein